MALVTPLNLIAALLALIPYLAVAFFPQLAAERVRALPAWMQFAWPAALAIPYLLVACGAGVFGWGWLALYALVPVAIALLLGQAARVDAGQHGNWRDFLVLAGLGRGPRLWPSSTRFSSSTRASTGSYSSASSMVRASICVCAGRM
jgi:hypothetical protein